MMEKFKNFLNSRKDRIVEIVLVALALPLIATFSVPFEIYANNLAESNFNLGDFIGMSILLSFLVFLFVFIVLFVVPKKAYKILKYMAVAFGLLLFMQGLYLNYKMDSVGGDNLATTAIPVWFVILDNIIWVGLLGVAAFLGTRKDEKGFIKLGFTVLSVVIVFTQVVTFIFNSINHPDAYKSKNDRDDVEKSVAISTRNLTDLSENENVIYFIIDRFDEKFAEEAYKKNSHVFDELDGFTWFQDNMGKYGHTFAGVSTMITSKTYRAEQRREEFLKTAYDGNTPLKELHEAGYRIDLYTGSYYSYLDGKLPDYISNYEEGKFKVANKFGLAFNMTRYALYRCFPYPLKDSLSYLATSTYNSYSQFESLDEKEKNYDLDNKNLWNTINEKEFTKTSDKVFKYIHFEGCHNANYDENFEKNKDKKNMYGTVVNSFKIIGKYINYLKEIGAYDNSTIIITGDHGNPKSDLKDIEEPILTALFAKTKNQSGNLVINSESYTCQDNSWPTIMKSINLTTSNWFNGVGYFDDSLKNENTKRTYIWHTYMAMTLDECVWQITGSAKKFENWVEIEKIHYERHLMD